MLAQIPTLGIVFDSTLIEDKEATYGFHCWRLFWRAVPPERICDTQFFEGDLASHETYFCIALQTARAETFSYVKEALSENSAFRKIAGCPPFLEDSDCLGEPLVDSGRVDATGNFVGNAGSARSALGTVRREGAEDSAVVSSMKSVPPRQKAASTRTASLPPFATFADAVSFINSKFTPRWYEHASAWLTPEELCDLVEHIADLVEVSCNQWSCANSEDLFGVFLRAKAGNGLYQFTGLFPFASAEDAKEIFDEWKSAPKYAAALPTLAGLRSRYQMNFEGKSHGGSGGERGATVVAPEALWPRLYQRKQSLVQEIQREEDAARIRREERVRKDQERAALQAEQDRQVRLKEERGRQGLCIFCGRKLGIFDRIAGRPRHTNCSVVKE